MRLFLDTCVLYPTITRRLLLSVAQGGGFEPRWSDSVEAELTHAYARVGASGKIEAEAVITAMRRAFDNAVVRTPQDLRLYQLPDVHDAHIFGAAVHGSCDGIVTFNAKDFPKHILAQEGLLRLSPDEVFLNYAHAQTDHMRKLVQDLWSEYQSDVPSEAQLSQKAFVKRAKAPGLAKYLELT